MKPIPSDYDTQIDYLVDELLTSLDASETDLWEGGLICTPHNRRLVKDWLAAANATQANAERKAPSCGDKDCHECKTC